MDERFAGRFGGRARELDHERTSRGAIRDPRGNAPAPPSPIQRPEVQRPLLKYVTFSGGPLDGQVHRIPPEHDSIQSSDGSVTYRDSGEMLNGYPRFDHISE